MLCKHKHSLGMGFLCIMSVYVQPNHRGVCHEGLNTAYVQPKRSLNIVIIPGDCVSCKPNQRMNVFTVSLGTE